MLGEGRSIQLFRVFGIRIGASPSWFVFLFLAIYLLSGSFRDALGGSTNEAYVVAVLAAFGFFLSILLHELGHALQARREGIEVEGVDLWFFGGLAKLSRDSRTPGEEFRVAAAGPAVTLAIAVLAFAGAALLLGGGPAVDVATLERGSATSPAALLLGWLVTMNVALFVFNLVPAFPLDGGRITRAIAWRVTGNRVRATVVAARLGQGFGYLLIAFGAYQAFVLDDTFGGIWSAVLGWLIAGAARAAAVSAEVGERISIVTVSDVMDPSPETLPGSTPLLEAEAWFERTGWEWVGVVDEETGRLTGLATREGVRAAVDAGRPALPVADTVEPAGAVAYDQPLETALGAEPLRRLGAVLAVDPEGRLRGVLTVEQVRRALTSAVPTRAG